MSTAEISHAIESPQLDERVWQAWLEKNRQSERLGFEKRLRLGLVISPVLIVVLLYWLLKTF